MNVTRRAAAAMLSVALLAGCGGGGGDGKGSGSLVVAGPMPTPTPSPSPTPAPVPSPTLPSEARIVLSDKVNYTVGQYNAYASPWCSMLNSSLVVGVDLKTTISLLPSAFPNDVEIVAQAPDKNPNDYGCGVYGFHNVSIGNADNTVPQRALEPRQVKDIGQMVLDFAWRDRAAGGQYNLLTEFYLTSQKGRAELKLFEIGWFFHAPRATLDFARSGSNLGGYTDPHGRAWQVYQVAKFIMLFPADDRDLMSGKLDMGHFLKHLKAVGRITGEEWVNGAAMGIEPVRGNSAIWIERFGIDFS